MKLLATFLLGILVAVGAVWLFSREDGGKKKIEAAGQQMKDGARELSEKAEKAVDQIDTAKVKEELRRAGEAVADVSADALISAKVKAKFAADNRVSALRIDVDTTDGLVTLSGRANSEEEINRALELARSVEGVKQVISTLQLAKR